MGRTLVRYFNSIKVQLELLFGQHIAHECLFQFHKGTIRTMEPRVLPKPFDNFNSIKVQLEQTKGIHRGRYTRFQFHKGTIRTPCSLRSHQTKRYFNSIKVQLELGDRYKHIYQ